MSEVRSNLVGFADESVRKAFERLKGGKHEEKELSLQIENAIKELEKSPTAGIRIPRKVWPRIYIQKYEINNLWKYNLPHGWRLIYTITPVSIDIVSIIMEWLDHPAYERRFGYNER